MPVGKSLDKVAGDGNRWRMGQDETWGVDTAARYDTPGTGMFALEVLGR
jgi:hypothetical protein